MQFHFFYLWKTRCALFGQTEKNLLPQGSFVPSLVVLEIKSNCKRTDDVQQALSCQLFFSFQRSKSWSEKNSHVEQEIFHLMTPPSSHDALSWTWSELNICNKKYIVRLKLFEFLSSCQFSLKKKKSYS